MNLVGVVVLQVLDFLILGIVKKFAKSSLLGIVIVEGFDLTLQCSFFSSLVFVDLARFLEFCEHVLCKEVQGQSSFLLFLDCLMQQLSPFEDDLPASLLVNNSCESLVVLTLNLVGLEQLHALDFGVATEDDCQVTFLPTEIFAVAAVPLKAVEDTCLCAHVNLCI